MTTHLENIHCPTCDAKHTWVADNPFRPFCSERCKLIDLGAWAAEDHRITSNEPVPGETDEDI